MKPSCGPPFSREHVIAMERFFQAVVSSRMTQLVRFMLFNLTAGFLIGLVVGFAFMQASDLTHLPAQEPLAAVMLLWGFGAGFGMGVLGTGLGMLHSE